MQAEARRRRKSQTKVADGALITKDEVVLLLLKQDLFYGLSVI